MSPGQRLCSATVLPPSSHGSLQSGPQARTDSPGMLGLRAEAVPTVASGTRGRGDAGPAEPPLVRMRS